MRSTPGLGRSHGLAAKLKVAGSHVRGVWRAMTLRAAWIYTDLVAKMDKDVRRLTQECGYQRVMRHEIRNKTDQTPDRFPATRVSYAIRVQNREAVDNTARRAASGGLAKARFRALITVAA